MEKLPKFPAEQLLAETLKTQQAVLAYEKLFLGMQIKKMRRKLNMGQKQLASKLSTSQSAVARIEAGKQNLTLQMLIRIGFTLGKKLFIRFQ